MLEDGSIVFDNSDNFMEQLNQGKEVDISVPSQPVNSVSRGGYRYLFVWFF